MKKVKFLQILLIAVMFVALLIPAAAADDYVTIDECCYLLGNVDNDDRVSSADARLALRFSVELEELDASAQKRADMNGDGIILASDARSILRLAVQLDPLPDHQIVTDAAVAATCTENGLTAGEHCAVCERVFVAQEVVPALGHDYKTTETSAKLTVSGAEVTACSHCGDTQEEAGDMSYLGIVAYLLNAWVGENATGAAAVYNENETDFVITLDKTVGGSGGEGSGGEGSESVDIFEIIKNAIDSAEMAFDILGDKVDKIAYIKADGVTVFEDGKVVNSGIKAVGLSNALGFIEKMAALTAENNGILELEISADIGFGNENFTFIIDIEGDRIEAIANAAAKIADHVAMTNDGDETTITVKMPEKVMNKAEEILQSKGLTMHEVMTGDMTVKGLLTDLGLVDWTKHFSEANLNRLNTVLAKIDGNTAAINKALDRIEVLKINGVDVLKDTEFKGLGTYATFLKQIKTRYITNEFGALKIGDFIQEDGTLLLSIEIAVNIDSERFPTDGTVYEKINLVIDLGKDYTAHTEEIIPGYAATCDDAGLTDGAKCSVCEAILIKQEEIPALGHEPGANLYTNEIAANCTQAGSYDIVVYCARCEEERSRTSMIVPALGHDEIAHDGKAASCTEDGYAAYVTCSRCDYTTYEDIAALGHDEISHDGKAATCTEDGYAAYVTCSRCDYSTCEAIPAFGHDYDAVVTAPTCEESGYTTYTCFCDDSYIADATDALGHAWDDGVVQGEKIVFTCKNDSSHTREKNVPGKKLSADDFTVREAEIHLGCKVFDPETEDALITCTAEDAVVTYLYGATAETAKAAPDSFGIYHVYASVAAENGYDADLIELTELLEGAVLYLCDTEAIMTALLPPVGDEEFNSILIACSDLDVPFVLPDDLVVHFSASHDSPYEVTDFRYYLPGRSNENTEVAEYVYGEDAFTYMVFRCTTAADYLEQFTLTDRNGIHFEDSYDALSNTVTIKICGAGETKLADALRETGLKSALTNTELLKTCYVADEPDVVLDIAESIGTPAKERIFIDDLLTLMGIAVTESCNLAECAAVNDQLCPIVFENEATWEGAVKLTYEVIKIQIEFVVTD